MKPMTPWKTNPPEDQLYRFVLQAHIRGRSVHGDFRYEFESETLLLGWTLDAIKSTGKEKPDSLSECKQLCKPGIKTFSQKLKDPDKKILSQQKKVQPYEWLHIDNAIFEPGDIGASKNEYGYMYVIDHGILEYGCVKPYYYELFCRSLCQKKNRMIHGRLVFRFLENIWRQTKDEDETGKTGKKSKVWMSWITEDPEPYVLSQRAVDKSWIPDFQISAIPRKIRNQIPFHLRYWTKKDRRDRFWLRRSLVNQINSKTIKIVY